MKGKGKRMKTKICKVIVACALAAVPAFALTACGSSSSDGESASAPSGQISVYSREDGSGTRGAFVELTGVEEDDVDNTVDTASITNSTSVMMTSVAGDENGIGYISLGSLDETVKAIQVDGVDATADNVKNGSYSLSRPFNIVTKDGLSDAAQDFINYIKSSEGQTIVEENGYVSNGNDGAYKASKAKGKVVVAGSSSVTPVMEKIAEAYMKANTNVTIEVQESDSTTGINMATEGTCDIGMASRELKDSEKSAGVTSEAIALDGIAVIVNTNATSVTNLTIDQIKQIFTGAITNWEDVLS
jgi:phosphate transport system substrate-binding protein